MYPPHLPPPTCNVSRHHQWQRLKIIAISTFFGLLAGLSGAAVTVALIWPNSDVTAAFVSRIPRSAVSPLEINDLVVRQLAGTTFEIYKKASLMSGVQYLAPADRLATGVVGVSSGWLIAAMPENDRGLVSDWQVLGEDGAVYGVAKVLLDSRAGLTYVKLTPSVNARGSQEQFRVAQFESTLIEPGVVFVWQAGTWVPTVLQTIGAVGAPAPHHDMVTALRYELADAFPRGSVVMTSKGVVVGMVTSDTQVVPTVSVVSMLSGIDDRTSITYPTFGLEGWFSDEWPLIVGGERVTGFLVSRVNGKAPLKRGDIIQEVNGRPVDFATWWSTRGDNEVVVEVLRAGDSLTVTLPRSS